MKVNRMLAMWIVIAIVALIAILSFQGVSDSVENKIRRKALEAGLDNVKVSAEKKEEDLWTIYTVESSNFTDLSYDEIFALNKEITSFEKDVQYSCNGDIYECNNRERLIEKNGQEFYNDYENSEVYQDEVEKDAERASYANKYPSVGMREEFLPYTILGKPNEIEKCKDFDHYRSTRKTKTYTWYETENHGRWEVTVIYAEYKSSEGGYEEYPTYNGIVGYMTYNEKGKSPVTVYE